MPKILLSYRRSDSQAMAGRIFDRLSMQYGEDAVFMDIDAIPFGVDFRKRIGDALGQCDVMIALIGPHWLGQRQGGAPRIQEPGDPVRLELEGALAHGVPVIPVLIDAATMPGEADLPETLKQFSFFNAAPVDSGRDFRTHMQRLIRALDGILAGKGGAAAQHLTTSGPTASRGGQTRARKLWYALAAVALLVGMAGSIALLWPKPRGEVAGPGSAGAPPTQPAQPALVLKSGDVHIAGMLTDEAKAADVGLAVQFDAAAGALGVGEQWDAMVKGELDLATFYLDSASDKVPAFAATFMPGLVRNHEHARRVGASAFMAEIRRLSASAGVIVLADGWLSTAAISKGRCIQTPADLKGRKVYALGEGLGAVLKASGATLTDISDHDVSTAFQSGADAMVTSPVTALRVADQARCITIPGDYSIAFTYLPMLASKKNFEKLNRNQQNALLKVAKQAEQSLADGNKELDAYLVRMLGTSGAQLVPLSQTDYESWVAAAHATAYKQFAAKVPGGQRLIEEALAVK